MDGPGGTNSAAVSHSATASHQPAPSSPQSNGSSATAALASSVTPGAAGGPTLPNVPDPRLYINRELSWLEFNQRVLDEAGDPTVPLLERLKFLAIVSTNLDEFFMIRVAGVKQQLAGDLDEPGADGLSPAEQLAAISARTHRMISDQYTLFNEQIRPRLQQAGIVIATRDTWSPEVEQELRDYFGREIYPVLTPLAIDPGHPFPRLKNKSLNLAVTFAHEGERGLAYAVVQVPTILPRLVPIKVAGAERSFALLEDVIARHAGELFPGLRVLSVSGFRVTRNWDLDLDEEEAQDLLVAIQQELRRRDRGNAVRMEAAATMEPGILQLLRKELRLEKEDVYSVNGPVHLGDFMSLYSDDRPELHDPTFTPQIPAAFRDQDDMFAVIAERDVILQHPYESFADSVAEFVARAADDPKVLAIKQTLYRAGANSSFVRSLARAADNGKQVTALVELKARFDEENNIQWARALEESGVHVVYGLIGLKTHAKVCLVVRRESTGLRRYVHMSTGNYNSSTARVYTDLSMFTARKEIGEDATALFNLLTGYSAPASWKRLVVAPLGLHETVLSLIHREAEHAKAGKPARIIAKMNSLVDPDVIDALYFASQAGVQIDLIVRGICCLLPGLPGVSEKIRVISVVDRFLEHSRIVSFENGGNPEVFLASADWMPRNFHRRVEVMWPIEDKALATYVRDEILAVALADNQRARVMKPDGTYEKREPVDGEVPLRSQVRFIEIARERARASRLSIPSSPFRLLSIADRQEEIREAGPERVNGGDEESRHRRKRRRGRNS
jgi:polyphosphate kinase